MKHLKKYKIKKLKYKESDIVGYDRYVDYPAIPVRILRTTPTSPYPYFVEKVFPPYKTYVLKEDDIIKLTSEQLDKINLKINTDKYNI